MTEAIRKRRKEARPEEILAAAIAVLGEVGFANARMADIAKRAGIAKGTIYLYFKTKDELFQGVVQHYQGGTLGRLDEIKATFEGTAGELLSTAIQHAYRELVGSWERRTIMRILISEGARFPQLTSYYHREVISRGILMVKTLLERGVAQGEFREEVLHINPAVVMGPMIMASVWKMIFDEVSPLDVEEYARGHVEIVMRGVMKA
ncbi:TetR/AcrR family transcriptional regulator [Lacunimicrobium album]